MIQKENSFGTFDQEINAFFKDAHHFFLSDQYLFLSGTGDRQTTRSDAGESKDTGLYKRCADVMEWKVWQLLSWY